MNMSTNIAVPSRTRQVAVVPVNQIQPRDVARNIKAFDDWLVGISDGTVTLEDVRRTAGNVPTLRNILPLADLLGDIVMLLQNPQRQPHDWAGLGINLLGALPAPNTVAARMSLRPMLYLTGQALEAGGEQPLNESLLATLATHLNTSIKGELDDFVQRAKAALPSFLDEAATLGQGLVMDLANGLDALASGKPGIPVSERGTAQSAAADSQSWRDPASVFSNVYDAAFQFHKRSAKDSLHAGAGSISSASPAGGRVMAGKLHGFALELAMQVRQLADAGKSQSLGWTLAQLEQALATQGSGLGQSANVKPAVTSVSQSSRPGQPLEACGAEGPTSQDPIPCKNCAASGTGSSISFTTGSEMIAHTDFHLPGPFPLAWTRTYRSSLGAYDNGELGARWITPYTTRFDVDGKGLRYHGADGRIIDYPLPKVGGVHDDRIEDITLVRVSEHRLVLCRGYEYRETYQRHSERYLLVQVELRGGVGLLLGYDHRVGERVVLSDLVTYQDDPSQPHTHLGTDVDAHGRITGLWLMGETTPERRLSLYHYDEAGDLTLAQDENTAVWTYTYQHHLITRYTDRTGRGMNLAWQGESTDARAVHEWADDGSFEMRLEWDPNIRLTYVTDAHGQETWHYYDSQGYTYRVVHPDKRSEWFYRDAAKNVIHHTHTDGSADRYAYDENGNLLEHIRADGTTVHYAWNTKDQLIKISDAEGGLWQRDYDTRGRLTEVIDPLGNKTEYAYNLMGLPIGITDANGRQKQLEYDTNGQLTRYVDCSGKVSTWTYDERGQIVQFTDASGQVACSRYEAGQLVAVQFSGNAEHRFERDAEGRLLVYTDPLGRRTRWSYTVAGLLGQRVDASDQTVHYHWDKLGRLVRLRNQNGRDSEFRYDSVGRLLAETGVDGATTRYEYDPRSGHLSSAVNGQRITAYLFDERGRLIERRAALKTGESIPRDADWQIERFAYDGNGNLALASNADSRLQWFHDAAGNLVREHQHYRCLGKPLVAVWLHEYDTLNQRTATVRPDGHRVNWLIYGSGYLLGLQLDNHELSSYERDDLHREVARLQGNRLLQTQRWDALGRLSEQVLARDGLKDLQGQTDGGRLLVRRYHYDAGGQLTGINDTRRGELRYGYDPVGRLLEAQSLLGVETFAFDPAGNLIDPAERREAERQRMPSPKALDNRLKQYGGTHYQYDAWGNLAHRWTNGQESHFTWDLFDRLTHYEDERLQADYGYDALGRRLYKHTRAHYEERREAGAQWNRAERLKVNRQHQCGFTLYGWDGDTLAWESTIADEDGFGARTTHYVYEPGTFVPVAQAVRADAILLQDEPRYGAHYLRDNDPLWLPLPPAPAIDSLAWYQCDHLGTPQALTDSSGRIIWNAEQCVWGTVEESSGNTANTARMANPIRFLGQHHDAESGLHYNRYRYYDPDVRRYVSKDPIGLRGGYNLYAYVRNAPTMRSDPLGLQVLGGFLNMPGVRARASEMHWRIEQGQSNEQIMREMYPMPRPILTGECRASGSYAVGMGAGVGVAANEISGPSGQFNLLTVGTGARAAASCGFRLRDPDAQNLPVSVGGGMGLGIFTIEVQQTDGWPELYIGLGPSIGVDAKTPVSPAISVPLY
ncbi:RHS repeat-associated core domain-containing protein [Paraburkholderia hayleyella]|uniref:RHS repeat-associated core domain-containing protein n=1 Tax=Paraburkholderia hayleyella TaxID=2152889 RepID=UPI001581307D|nr:RHS repeat-associated core domain-containing protein [Paraburkholderia hayleyella]